MSNLRKSIESRFADSVTRRVKLFWTKYRGHERAAILVDGEEIIQVDCCGTIYEWLRPPEHRDSRPYEKWDFVSDLVEYLNLPIEDIVRSETPMIRAIGMLDARVGKRTLRKLDIDNENPLAQRLFRLRCESEGMPVPPALCDGAITDRIQPQFSQKQWNRERKQLAYERTDGDLERSKRNRDLSGLIKRLASGQVNAEELEGSAIAIYDGYKQADQPEIFCDSFTYLLSSSDILEEPHLVLGVVYAVLDHSSWLQPISAWKPQTHNSERQFASLLRHLFAEWKVPNFMDKAWLTGNRLHQQWYKHIGKGENIRTAPGLQVKLTKMMAHHFLTAPDNYDIDAALRWGQMRSIDASQRVIDEVVATRLVESFVDNEFWMSVFRFFVRNPMLDSEWIGPIIDYFWNQKYEDQIVFVEAGVAENRGPAQPNMSMKGRDPTTLIRQVEAWHRALGRDVAGAELSWRKSAIPDFRFVEGSQDARNMRVYRITELLNGRELTNEGRELGHCVGSYARSCASGQVTIWSVTVESDAGTSRLLTIELRMRDKMIRQVRGQKNRFADSQENQLIQRWATQEKLTFEV